MDKSYRTVYKIKEEVFDDAVVIQVVMSFPNDEEYAEEFQLPNGNKIKVNPLWGYYEVSANPFSDNSHWHHVTLPNFIERLFGVTFQDKRNKARKICQKFINKRYKEQEKLNEFLKEEL